MTTAQTQAEALLPCPFCGREAMMSHSSDGEVCNVRCAGWSVGNCLGASPNCYTEADAVAGWNRRAPAVQAARALPEVDKSPDMQGQVVDKDGNMQGRAPADQWKCGNEFLPYHPSASHVEPAYRDGWNACFKAAAQVLAMGRVPVDAISALKEYEAFFDQLFAQACSNGLFDAWNRPINCTRLNMAHQMAERALKAHPTGD